MSTSHSAPRGQDIRIKLVSMILMTFFFVGRHVRKIWKTDVWRQPDFQQYGFDSGSMENIDECRIQRSMATNFVATRASILDDFSEASQS